MAKHFSYLETARRLAERSWGRQFESIEEAGRDLANSPDRLTAYALLGVLERFENFLAAMSEDRKEYKDSKPSDDAARFPDIKPGDVLYEYHGPDDVLYERVVVSVDDDRAFTVMAGSQWERPHSYWADSDCRRTPEAALSAWIESESKYINKLQVGLKNAKAALKAGGDVLAQYFNCPDDQP